MSLFLDDAPGEGWLNRQERARYAPTPFANVVKASRLENDSLKRVDRDPCGKCGTRKDIGCKHVRRAA